MEKRQFGKTDMQVSVLGFGGAEIGFERAPIEDVTRLLTSALDAGLNVIDTAECYLASEELIGEAVSGRRDEFYLFTKCGHPEKPGVGDWRPESLLGTITRSLTRLNTDRVDLVHLHSCSEEELRKGDVIAALQKAREKGYTRYIGYSGDGQAARYAVELRRIRLAADVGEHRRPGGARPDHSAGPRIADGRDRQAADRQRCLAVRRVALERLSPAVLGTPARSSITTSSKGDLQEAVSIALRFTLSVPGVHTAIVGTKNPNRWHENAELLARRPSARTAIRGDPHPLESGGRAGLDRPDLKTQGSSSAEERAVPSPVLPIQIAPVPLFVARIAERFWKACPASLSSSTNRTAGKFGTYGILPKVRHPRGTKLAFFRTASDSFVLQIPVLNLSSRRRVVGLRLPNGPSNQPESATFGVAARRRGRSHVAETSCFAHRLDHCRLWLCALTEMTRRRA